MKTTSKRFLVVLLTLVMAFSLAIPAMAAEGDAPSYTVGIYPNANTLIPTEGDDSLDERFDAYQIFAGELHAIDYDGGEEEGDPLDQPNANQLSNVTWGSGIDEEQIDALLDALQNDDTLGEALTEALADVSAEDAASVVANVLADLSNGNDASIARAFAKVVAEKDENGAYLYLATATPSDWDDDHWSIDLDGGYYLIVDTYAVREDDDNTDKANSDYLVGVFGDTKIYVKSNVPTVDKVIVEDDNTTEGTDAEIGKLVTFRLTGTLPENYDLYDAYYFAFKDTMSKGLTYANSMVVYAIIGEEDVSIDSSSYHVDGPTTNADGTTALEIAFADLKTALLADTSAKLDSSSVIVVEYKAYLNEDAATTGAETNTVRLEYSNDPTYSGDPGDSDKHGKTPDETVYVYEFGIDLYKYDAKEDEALEGAGFSVSDGSSYAIFAKDANGYRVAGWISGDDLDEDVDWGAAYTAAELPEAVWNESAGETGPFYLAVLSGEDGKLNIKGLEAGVTYTLTEVITPAGFDTLEGPITVKFTAEYFDEDYTTDEKTYKAGQLKTLRAEIGNPDGSTTTQNIVVEGEYGEYKEVGFTSYDAILDVPNLPSGWLPGTGGPGVILFYVGGALLLVGGVAFLVFSSVKKKKA